MSGLSRAGLDVYDKRCIIMGMSVDYGKAESGLGQIEASHLRPQASVRLWQSSMQVILVYKAAFSAELCCLLSSLYFHAFQVEQTAATAVYHDLFIGILKLLSIQCRASSALFPYSHDLQVEQKLQPRQYVLVSLLVS